MRYKALDSKDVERTVWSAMTHSGRVLDNQCLSTITTRYHDSCDAERKLNHSHSNIVRTLRTVSNTVKETPAKPRTATTRTPTPLTDTPAFKMTRVKGRGSRYSSRKPLGTATTGACVVVLVPADVKSSPPWSRKKVLFCSVLSSFYSPPRPA